MANFVKNSVFFIKQIFNNYKEFEDSVELYEKSSGYTISVVDSKKNIESQDFEYLYKTLKCVRSGTAKPKGKGLRNKKSNKINCPFLLRIKISKDKKNLFISQLNLIHNHVEDNATNNSASEQLFVAEFNSPDQFDVILPTVIFSLEEQNETDAGESRSTKGKEKAALEEAIAIEKISLQEICKNKDEEKLEKNVRKENTSTFVAEFNSPDSFDDILPTVLFSLEEQTEKEAGDSRSIKGKEKEALEEAKAIEKMSLQEICKNKDEEKLEKSARKENISALKEEINYINKEQEKKMESVQSSLIFKEAKKKEIVVLEKERNKEMKKSRGRPKGTSQKTAIGLQINKGPVPYVKLEIRGKLKKALQWLNVSKQVIDLVSSGEYVLQHEKIEGNLKNISDSFLAEEVNVEEFKNFFEAKCLRLLKIAIAKKKGINTFTCKICNLHVRDDQKSILCDSCLIWYHSSCVNIKLTKRLLSEGTFWFCKKCSGN